MNRPSGRRVVTNVRGKGEYRHSIAAHDCPVAPFPSSYPALPPPMFRVRRLLCLLASVLISTPLAAQMRSERLLDWSQCPVEDAVPAFADAPPVAGSAAGRETLPTDVDGDQVEGIEGQLLNITGNVVLRRGDQFLGADDLQYSQDTRRYVALGNVRYQDSGVRLIADRLEGNQDADSHIVDNVRYQLIERRGHGVSRQVELAGTHGRLHGSTYSTCPPSQHIWELRAHRIDINTDSGIGVARGARFRVGKVPVLYVPWFAFPIDDRRSSGLLYPRISRSNRNGLDWAQPIYLNLAPHYDLTLVPRWMSRRGLHLGSELRYLHPRGNGRVEFEYMDSDQLTVREREREITDGIRAENRRRRDRIRGYYSGRQRLTNTWQARSTLRWISDPRYIEDFSNSLDGNAGTYLRSSTGLYGRGRWWNASLSANWYQLTDYLRAETSLPYHRLPRLALNWQQPFGRHLLVGFNSALTRFQHETANIRSNTRVSGGVRLDVKPSVSMPLEGASWFVTPALAWRHTAWQLDEPLSAGGEKAPERSLPIASVDAGLFFERQAKVRGRGYLHTLEPRLFYLNAPYRDQSAIPLFDTRPLSFSWGQLFRDNRYSGGDRQADANQLTLGLTTRLIREADGREKLSASIGQIHYFEDSRIRVGNERPVERGRSAWVSEATYAINDRWTLSGGYQWNPSSRRDDLVSIRTRYLIGERGIANLAYRYRRHPSTGNDLIEQVDFSFLYPLNHTWSLVGRSYYSLLNRRMLEGIGGVQWENCCMAARLITRRYVRNFRGDINTAIQLEIEFKGLGSAGPNAQDRLRQAIVGYHRDDLYLVPPSERGGAGDDDSHSDLFP